MSADVASTEVTIPAGDVELKGILNIPRAPRAIVIFAHGSGSSRTSRRNAQVARVIEQSGFATLLMDLLTLQEEREDAATGHLRFDIALLARRLGDARRWLAEREGTTGLPAAYFGASTGAAAALVAAADDPTIFAVVSRGGRPDLASESLRKVKAPTLLIVGGADVPVIPLNQEAYEQLSCTKEQTIIPHAGHLFEEVGALDRVADLAAQWFGKHVPTKDR